MALSNPSKGLLRITLNVYRDLQKFQHAYAQTQTLDAKAELIESELQQIYDGKRSRAILWRMQHPHLKVFRRDLDEELQPIEGRRCLAVDSARRKAEKKKAKLGKVAQTRTGADAPANQLSKETCHDSASAHTIQRGSELDPGWRAHPYLPRPGSTSVQ
ncbi:hypothetical protein Cob_v000406 [Colletotrichum orbiculare MAFF 240422]|uniref:Uncharacterized protein n=1 Tax=Colletotrichum orbiculare (strain 104-T / ATCC 96160 / CBS 514.97 / LARS 414 / MAFF 240422) TaxID=1213857 RepID=A0A484G6N5_COLOR|nr:hypothetical protein Cob_v000406 [Colletotrichum orbiculare MAFF 240422]